MGGRKLVGLFGCETFSLFWIRVVECSQPWPPALALAKGLKAVVLTETQRHRGNAEGRFAGAWNGEVLYRSKRRVVWEFSAESVCG